MLRDKWFAPKLIALMVAASILITVIVVALRVPSALPPEGKGEPPAPAAGKETMVVRSVVVTDEKVLPLLPLEGAKLHFIPGNKIEVGHESVPWRVTIRCGASGGLLWFSGIPSSLNLAMIDSNIDSYCSRWMPAWSFIVDSSMAASLSVVPEDGIRTGDATPLFDWSTIADEPEAKYYLHVGVDRDFESPLLRKDKEWIKDTHYQVAEDEAFTDGEYYWRLMQRGRIWITGMPPWLDLSRYDPEVTEMPTVVSIETGDGTAQINYIID